MSFIADNVSAGLDPLQDVDKEMDIAFRTVRQGCRVLRRDDVGDLIIDRNAIGDIHGWVLWNQVPNGRPCPAFAQVWPARVASAAGGGRDTVTGADMFGILPITTFFDYDTRYGVKTPLVGRANPGRRQRAWNRAPRGQVGIIVSTTNEYDLDELFLPTDPRMIAPNIRGDGACGSIVCDLDDNNSHDVTRYARLQTMMRVVPLGTSGGIAGFVPDPESSDGAMLGAIAWNLNLTGREGALGRGLVIDQASGAMPPPPPPVMTPTLPTPTTPQGPPPPWGPPPPPPPPGKGP